ncbi:MAG: beta-ketoacyl synthase, partial [Firmicutes bacterium]|nr:beta-ketoacyl synthase [Bacillota bacterium]
MSEQHSWFVPHRQSPRARLRLYCFPYAGGGASLFRTWGQFLPETIAVVGVQLPGRESRLQEPAFHRLEPMVAALTAALRWHADLPFAFFGHSMGALIGFEVARSLRRQQLPGPVHLIASGAAAPQIPRREPPIHGLSDGAFLAELHRLGGTPQ